jgi:DNA-binding protein H-NS
VHKQIGTLKNTLNQTSNNAKLLEQGVQQRQEETESLAQQMDEANERYANIEGDTA